MCSEQSVYRENQFSDCKQNFKCTIVWTVIDSCYFLQIIVRRNLTKMSGTHKKRKTFILINMHIAGDRVKRDVKYFDMLKY